MFGSMLDMGMVLTVPCLEACSIPCMSKSRHASRAHAMTASFFLPDTVASATKTSPLGPSTGSLCERTARNSEEITGLSTKGQHKTMRKLQDHPQKDSTKQWGNYRTIHKRTAQNSEEITGPSTKGQHKTMRKLQDHPQKDSTKQWGNYRTIHWQSVPKDSTKQWGNYRTTHRQFV